MQITPDLIKYLESLARIELTADEKNKVSEELQDILTYIEMLNELDTDDIEPVSHAFSVTNVFRRDEAVCAMTPEQIVANAPESKDNMFVVPKAVE